MSSKELELVIPGTGGQSCSDRRYLVRADLKLLSVDLERMALGILFQSLAPIILNQESYMRCILGLQDLDIGGILQQTPRRLVLWNSILRSLGVSSLRILNTCMIT